jgi:hypothetical protein
LFAPIKAANSGWFKQKSLPQRVNSAACFLDMFERRSKTAARLSAWAKVRLHFACKARKKRRCPVHSDSV